MDVQSFFNDAGYGALALLCFLEATCVPISSEVVFGFAGYLAFTGQFSLPLVIIIGTLAELAGSYTAYGIGRLASRPAVEKLGRYVLITKSDVDRAERFLVGRGSWAIPVGRMTPFIRAFISLVAGLVDVPPLRFGVLSLIGTVIYATVVSSIGYALGSAWHTMAHGLAIAGYIVTAVVVLAIVAFVAHRLREFRREKRERISNELAADGGEDHHRASR